MAASISAAETLPDLDYSLSHRSPPPVPNSPPNPHPDRDEDDGGRSPRQQTRFGTFLRRSSSRQSQTRISSGASITEPTPPLPASFSSSAPIDFASDAPLAPSSTKRSLSTGRNMLRKSSAVRKERERQAQEEREARRNQPPPQLPFPATSPGPLHPLTADASTPPPNFSRPGNAFASPAMAASSSPAYAVRSGNVLATPSPPPVARVLSTQPNGEYVHGPVSRSESMANRSRYSYASLGSAIDASNSPRRIRRRKDPTPFNVLVAGAKNSGKTSFISFLHHSLALPGVKPAVGEPGSTVSASRSSFTSHYLETEIDGERIGLTLWDSAGLEKHIIDLQLREMAAFVESKFEETFVEEQKVMRSPGIKDSHVHCVFLVLDPVRLDATIAASNSLHNSDGNQPSAKGLDDDLDLQVMRALWGKTTVVPLIAKADTLTTGHAAFLKRAVWESIRKAKLDPLEALELEDDLDEEDNDTETDEDDFDADIDSTKIEDPVKININPDRSPPSAASPTPFRHHHRGSSLTVALKFADDDTPYIPMAIISPDPYDLPPFTPVSPTGTTRPIGRHFPWGFADPLNATHCDFSRLRDSVFREWRAELRDLARAKWYEAWRTSRLKSLPAVGGAAHVRHRVPGGVTPTAAIPREGRFSPSSLTGRVVSAQKGGATNGAGGGAVPRSVVGKAGSAAVSPTALGSDGREADVGAARS